jgi:hypothetical protein
VNNNLLIMRGAEYNYNQHNPEKKKLNEKYTPHDSGHIKFNVKDVARMDFVAPELPNQPASRQVPHLDGSVVASAHEAAASRIKR